MAGDTYLFEPMIRHKEDPAIMAIWDEGESTLVIANAGAQPVLLEEGDLMGKL